MLSMLTTEILPCPLPIIFNLLWLLAWKNRITVKLAKVMQQGCDDDAFRINILCSGIFLRFVDTHCLPINHQRMICQSAIETIMTSLRSCIGKVIVRIKMLNSIPSRPILRSKQIISSRFFLMYSSVSSMQYLSFRILFILFSHLSVSSTTNRASHHQSLPYHQEQQRGSNAP